LEKDEEEKGREIHKLHRGNWQKIIKEEAENTCARPHSGIRLSVVNKVDNNSMKMDDDSKRNKIDNETAKGNKEMSIGGSGFSVPSPGYNCEGSTMLTDFRSSLDNVKSDGNNNNSTSGIHGLNINSKILIEEEAENACVVSPKENSRRINIGKDNNNNNHVHDNKRNNNNKNNEIPLKIQGADLRRYAKHKKRLHLMTAPLWYNCKKCTSKQECIEVGWVSIPSLLLLYTESMELQKLYRI
jgi:hypothetical protein